MVMPSAIRIRAHVRSVIDDDGAVLLDLKRGRYFSLNSTGVSVWRRLEAGATPAGIETELALHHPGGEAIRQDIAAFLDSLYQAELVDAIE
jgi:hypothetical protein